MDHHNDCIWLYSHGVRTPEGKVKSFNIPKGCGFIGQDLEDWTICLTCKRYKPKGGK